MTEYTHEIKISVEDNGLYVQVDAPTWARQKLKDTPGIRSVGKTGMRWRFPATPGVAAHLTKIFQYDNYIIDNEFLHLVQLCTRIQKVQHVKTSNKLKSVPNTQTEPWIQQLRAYHFARAMPGCMLAMDMGTGKTKVVIDLVQNLHLFRTLVIAPKAVAEEVWPNEILEHGSATEMVVLTLLGKSVAKRVELADSLFNAPTDNYSWRWFIINYEAAWREPFKSWALKQHWNLVVADESHRIKGAGSQISKFLYRLGQRADRRLCLTGTPLPNGPMDAYGQYRFIDCGIFGTDFSRFQNRYAVMGGFENREIIKYKNQKRMKRMMHQIMYSVESDDVQDFPPETDAYRYARLEGKSRTHYNALNKQFITFIGEGATTAENVLVKSLRLHEITSGYLTEDTDDPKRRIKHEINQTKRELLIDTLKDIRRQPIVVFGLFKWDLESIHAAVNSVGWTSSELSGSRNEVKEWKSGQTDVLVTQIGTGKEGLDFTRARYGIFYTLNFSLGDYRQMRKRIRRPGQDKPHTFVHLIISNTISEDIVAAIRAKEEPVDYLINKYRG